MEGYKGKYCNEGKVANIMFQIALILKDHIIRDMLYLFKQKSLMIRNLAYAVMLRLIKKK